MGRLLFRIALLCGVSAGLAPGYAAAEDARPAVSVGAAKAKIKKRRAGPAAPTAPAVNLNAPSMDFTGVTPETGDAPDPRRGPRSNIRPSIGSNGLPAMGLGF